MAMKTTSPLAGLFRKSPFEPIQQHMRVVFSCVCLVPDLFDALYKKDETELIEVAGKICDLETQADKMKSNFRLHMPTGLLMPVARRDILSLIKHQDCLADNAEQISNILLTRDMVVPEAIKPALDDLLEGTMEASSQALNMIEELDELLAIGFGMSREQDLVKRLIALVRQEEHRIDALVQKIYRTLFQLEGEMNPVSVMFWYKIIDLLSDISDEAENMADRVLLFMSK